MKEKSLENEISQQHLRELKKDLKRRSKNELIYIVTAMVVEKLMAQSQQPKDGE